MTEHPNYEDWIFADVALSFFRTPEKFPHLVAELPSSGLIGSHGSAHTFEVFYIAQNQLSQTALGEFWAAMIYHELELIGEFMEELKADKDRGLLDVKSPEAIEIREILEDSLERLLTMVQSCRRRD